MATNIIYIQLDSKSGLKPFYDPRYENFTDALTHQITVGKNVIKYHPQVLMLYSSAYRFDPVMAITIIKQSRVSTVEALLVLMHTCKLTIKNKKINKVVKLAKKLGMTTVANAINVWIAENTDTSINNNA